MLNRITFEGRLTKDPELRISSGGKKFVAITIAHNDSYNRQQTNYIPVFIWNKAAENTVKYLQKGSLVSIDGKVYSRQVIEQDKQFNKVEVMVDSIYFLSKKNNQEPIQKPVTESDIFDNYKEEETPNISLDEAKKMLEEL